MESSLFFLLAPRSYCVWMRGNTWKSLCNQFFESNLLCAFGEWRNTHMLTEAYSGAAVQGHSLHISHALFDFFLAEPCNLSTEAYKRWMLMLDIVSVGRLGFLYVVSVTR